MGLRDRAFQRVFSCTFVYNILFEDSEVDERYLGIDEDSTVLSITGAGCGVAGMVSRRPRRIDAVDINRHHLALAALKCVAAQHMRSYDEFYELLARGYTADPKGLIRPLANYMPSWVADYWKRHARRFEQSFYLQGLTAKMLGALRKQMGMGVEWARSLCALPVSDRIDIMRESLERVNNPFTRAVLSSPLQLIALGINYQQRDRMLNAEDQNSMIDFFFSHISRVMETDLWKNWIFWYGAAGTFNLEDQEALPPYLRHDRWDRSMGAPTDLNFVHGNLFDVLEQAGPKTWSHYTLCDAVDWMPHPVQQKLFDEIRRTARPGATVLMRSVELEDPTVPVGANAFLEKLDCSEAASLADRSRQYRQVNFYRVHA